MRSINNPQPRRAQRVLLASTLATMLAGASLVAGQAQAGSEIFGSRSGDISDAGDVIQILLPAGGLAYSLWIDDTDGAWMLTKSVATSTVITHGLKAGFGRLRPDGSSQNSFPSGHTQAAFSGASYIYLRYGSEYGIPAYGAAAFVGASRMWANRHFLDDVMAGASIATLSSLYWVQPHSSRLAVLPVSDGDAVGVQLSYNPDADLSGKVEPPSQGYRYELAVGAAYTNRNIVSTPGGSEFNYRDFDRTLEPNTYGSFTLEKRIGERSELAFNITPYESRDKETLTQSITFDGRLYAAGETIVSAYRAWHFSGDWYYNWTPQSRWKVDTGLALTLQALTVELDDIDGGNLGSVSELEVVPLLAANLGYQFTPKLSAVLNARGISFDRVEHAELFLKLRYQLDSRWDVGGSIGRYRHQYDGTNLNNELDYDLVSFNVGYSF